MKATMILVVVAVLAFGGIFVTSVSANELVPDSTVMGSDQYPNINANWGWRRFRSCLVQCSHHIPSQHRSMGLVAYQRPYAVVCVPVGLGKQNAGGINVVFLEYPLPRQRRSRRGTQQRLELWSKLAFGGRGSLVVGCPIQSGDFFIHRSCPRLFSLLGEIQYVGRFSRSASSRAGDIESAGSRTRRGSSPPTEVVSNNKVLRTLRGTRGKGVAD